MFAYTHHLGGGGIGHLLTYIVHYFIARILFDSLRSAGLPLATLLVVPAAIGLWWAALRAGARRRRNARRARAYEAALDNAEMIAAAKRDYARRRAS